MRAIAVSLGGTKLRIASVSNTGTVNQARPTIQWRDEFGLSAGRLRDGDRLVQRMAALILEEWQRPGMGEVHHIGLATKGPLEVIRGLAILGRGRQIENLPFLNYRIAQRLRQQLVALASRDLRHVLANVRLTVMHDGAAAALGEVSSRGSFPGARNACAVILGTGVGLGVVRHGRNYIGDECPMTRVLGSLGRHLIRCRDTSGRYRYVYRKIAKRATRARIDPDAGECYFSDRVSGPSLAERLARSLLDDAGPELGLRLDAMNLADLSRAKLRHLSRRRNRDKMKSLEARLLAGVTTGAKSGDVWCRRAIEDCGHEIGDGLAAFVATFSQKAFVRRIALVSTLAERLGKGVQGNTTHDLFLEAITRTLRRKYVQVVRSQCVDRELLAFVTTASA
jgi:predicted NBD/HSP70 family sugar kinase